MLEHYNVEKISGETEPIENHWKWDKKYEKWKKCRTNSKMIKKTTQYHEMIKIPELIKRKSYIVFVEIIRIMWGKYRRKNFKLNHYFFQSTEHTFIYYLDYISLE